MSRYGPHDRELFQSGASALYESIVSTAGISIRDSRITADGPDRAAFDLLVELGLVLLDKPTETWQPEDPSGIQSRVVSPLSQQGAKLLEESSSWAQAFHGLAQTWRKSPLAQARGPFTYLHEEAIGPFITGMVADTEEEMLTAQPQTGRNAQTLAVAALRDTNMLDRGITMRTLYQHSARRSSITHKYVAEVTSRGAEVRTLDEFFNRMIISDRRIAIIPGGDDLSVALAVREPSVIAYLLDVFERAWERGRPFTDSGSSMLKEVAAEQRAMTIRMLVEGHSDPISAKRLGVSPRTYAGYVADLKTEYDAQTRFQLGYVMGQRGISGNELPPDEEDPQD